MDIFVGNLPFNATEDDVKKLFEVYGDVSSVTIVMSKEKKAPKSRGFGFVQMPDEPQALTAIQQLNQKEFMGRPLNISQARPKPEPGERSAAKVEMKFKAMEEAEIALHKEQERKKYLANQVVNEPGTYRGGRRTRAFVARQRSPETDKKEFKPWRKGHKTALPHKPWKKDEARPKPWERNAGESKPWKKSEAKPKPWEKPAGAPRPWKRAEEKTAPWKKSAGGPKPWKRAEEKPVPWKKPNQEARPWDKAPKPKPWEKSAREAKPWGKRSKPQESVSGPAASPAKRAYSKPRRPMPKIHGPFKRRERT